MGALLIPGSYYFLNVEKTHMVAVLSAVAVLSCIVDVSRWRNWAFWRRFASRVFGSMVRQHEYAGDLSGATYILFSAALTIALFSREIAVAALAFIIVGDSLAALIGRKFGRHRIGDKSIEGSLACLAGTLVVAGLAPGLPGIVGIFGAVVATVVEALPWRLDDNISVPIISGIAMTLASRVLFA